MLEWLVQAVHDWKILDPKGLELDETQARDVFINGQGVFTSNVGNVLPRSNNPKFSKRAGDIAPTRFPGLTDAGKGPMGWTRLYCIDAKTKVKDAAWRLIYYMGGKDKRGVYYTAKDWYTKYGVGYSFMSLDKDADMIKVHKRGRMGPRGPEPAVRDGAEPDEHQGALVQRVGPVHPAADPERAPQEGEPPRRADGVGQQGAGLQEAVELTW